MIDWSALLEKIKQHPKPEGETATVVTLYLGKAPLALNNVLDILSEYWTAQAFVGGLEYGAGTHTLRTPAVVLDNDVAYPPGTT